MEKLALITGASTGIGRELAEVCAADGWNQILVARNQDRLKIVAEELRAVHKVQTRALPVDLSTTGAAEKIFAALRELPISVLINNAGFGTYGAFADTVLSEQSDLVQVNVMALMQLTRLFLQPMLERK